MVHTSSTDPSRPCLHIPSYVVVVTFYGGQTFFPSYYDQFVQVFGCNSYVATTADAAGPPQRRRYLRRFHAKRCQHAKRG